MANEQSGIKFFVILTICCLSAKVTTADSSDDGDGSSPLLDVMQQLLQDSSKEKAGSGIEAIGGMLQMFMQSGGGKQLGDLLSAGGDRKFKSNTLNVLAGLNSLWGSAKGKGGNTDGEEQGGAGASILGSMVDILSAMNQNDGEDNSIDDEVKVKPTKKKSPELNIDAGAALGMLGNLLSSMNGGNSDKGKSGGNGAGLETMLSFLPVLFSSLGGKHQRHSSSSIPHHTHEPFLPPFFENLHEYWDHFRSSEFGKALWENSPLATLMSQFQDNDGNYQVSKVFDSLENHNLRRSWVKSIASFITEWAKLIVDSETQKRYMATAQILINGYLQSEGYSPQSRLDFGKPGDTISSILDEVFKKQFSTPVESGKYIKPAISFFQDMFSKSQKSGFLNGWTTSSLETRLMSALDGELIEPVLRSYRAYKYALKKNTCARYVLCAIGKAEQSDSDVALKPAVVKISSLATAWFLSTSAKTSFWDLYAATVDTSCEKYDRKCFEFHEEDTRATTEYFHNEL